MLLHVDTSWHCGLELGPSDCTWLQTWKPTKPASFATSLFLTASQLLECRFYAASGFQAGWVYRSITKKMKRTNTSAAQQAAPATATFNRSLTFLNIWESRWSSGCGWKDWNVPSEFLKMFEQHLLRSSRKIMPDPNSKVQCPHR